MTESFDQVRAKANLLSPTEQARLIAHLANQMQHALALTSESQASHYPPQPSLTTETHTFWDSFMQVISDCQVETGISNLAHQHNHYLYNKPEEEITT